jgi:sec-independent protein translocase protein TatB
MLDIGIEKLMLVGGIALVVIGPERLPRVARTVGTLLGRAQRYVSDVKAEVNRSIELEELQKMKGQFEDAARDVHQTIHREAGEAASAFEQSWSEVNQGSAALENGANGDMAWSGAVPSYTLPRKKWRLKRSAVPRWYKHRQGVRTHVQSAAARVARFRP